MAYRPLLKADQWSKLIGAPTDEESLIRHYTLSGEDMDLALSKRGHRNQLGFAVQLCLMRFPGRALAPGEAVPSEALAFIGDQMEISLFVFADYARRDQTRRAHAMEAQQHLGLKISSQEDRRVARLAAIDAAMATDSGTAVAQAVVKSFRDRKILLPPEDYMDRIGRAGRAIARKRIHLSILKGVTSQQFTLVDDLLALDPAIKQTRFGWLNAWPDSPGASNLLGLMERLTFIRKLGLDQNCRNNVHPDRWRQIVREGAATPSWLAADFGAERKRATIIATLIDLCERLTDESVAMFCKQVGRLFSRASATGAQRYTDNRKETAKVLRLFRETLRVLLADEEDNSDSAIIERLNAEVGWHRLVQAQPTVEAMVKDSDSDALLLAVQGYTGLRKYAPQFLDAFVFRSSRRHDPLLAAIDVLRTMNREARRALPAEVTTQHLTAKAKTSIFADGKSDRRLYEIATLAVLREKLRSGDISVEGSRTFRSFADHLMPKAAFEEKKAANALNLGVPGDFDLYLSQMRQKLDFSVKRLCYHARAGKLEGVRLENDELIVSPLKSEVPEEAETLKWELNHCLPRIHITDLLAEVNGWTGFSDRFTHLRTLDAVRNGSAILAAVLADATNLGAKRMAEASANVSERQIGWARQFHVRPETYKAAQVAVTDAHSVHPHASLWGAGITSSSDGQFFRAGDRAAARSDVNLHYGSEPGAKFYSHLSDQYGYFSILPISPTESEAPYVLDGLFDHETRLDIAEHFTDTGGSSDHVFALFALLGKRFSPRLRDLKLKRFHTFDGADAYPALRKHIGLTLRPELMREHWSEILHMAASMNDRVVAPSTILKKLSAAQKPSLLSKALSEVGRLERTLFMIEYYSDPALRRRCQGGLNKGEAAHKLKRAVFFHESGEIRDRSFDSQAFRASGLNLVVAAIVYWNTVYLARAADHLRSKGRVIPDNLLKHVSPLTWEHINLTGTYSWQTEPANPDAFKPIREGKPQFWAAA